MSTNYIKSAEVIKRLSISRSTLNRMIANGRLKAYSRVQRGNLFFLETDVMNLLKPSDMFNSVV